VITTTITQGFTAIVACLILFRSIRTTLELAKLLLSFLLASNLLLIGANIMLWWAYWDQVQKDQHQEEADIGKFWHAYAILYGLGILFVGLVQWIYPFQLWDLSKRMLLIKNKCDPESSLAVKAFYYGGISAICISSGLVAWNFCYPHSRLVGAAVYQDFYSITQLVPSYLLVDGVRRINYVIKDEPCILSNQRAIRLHLLAFCLYSVTLLWQMVDNTLYFKTFFSSPTTWTVTFYFTNVT